MACFTAPLAEAVIVKAIEKNIEKKGTEESSERVPLTRKVKWLSTMLSADQHFLLLSISGTARSQHGSLSLQLCPIRLML